MRPVAVVRNHPVALLVVLAVGFGAWIAWDAIDPGRESAVREFPSAAITLEGRHAAAVEVLLPRQTGMPPPRQPDVAADVMPKLYPGMTRVEIESLLGPPDAGMVHPVREVGGRLTYRATYHATPDDPRATTAPAAPRVIGLEFDSTAPGHPLTRVHVTNPSY